MKEIVLLMGLIGLCLCSRGTAQAEVSDLGEFCFFMQNDIQFISESGTLQVGILSYGAGHFVVHGESAGKAIHNGPFHGTAMIEGNNILMSLVSSESNLKTFAATGSFSSLHISLDIYKLSGRFVNMTINYDGQVVRSPAVHGGSIVATQCQ